MVPGLTLMKQITIKVNSREHTVEVDPDTPLLFVLNDDLGLRGPRFGCGMAQCGACTVMMRGKGGAVLRDAGKSGGRRPKSRPWKAWARRRNLIRFSRHLLKRGRRNADIASAA